LRLLRELRPAAVTLDIEERGIQGSRYNNYPLAAFTPIAFRRRHIHRIPGIARCRNLNP